MRKYYYFLASLPSLSITCENSLAPDNFLNLAKYYCHPNDFASVSRALLTFNDGKSDFLFLRKWLNWEKSLRYALALARKENVNFKYELPEAPENLISIDAAQKALNEKNPFIAETIIDKARWTFIEELESGNFFNLNNLFAYYLKLQLLERRRAMTEEYGASAFEALYEKQKTAFADVAYNA